MTEEEGRIRWANSCQRLKSQIANFKWQAPNLDLFFADAGFDDASAALCVLSCRDPREPSGHRPAHQA